MQDIDHRTIAPGLEEPVLRRALHGKPGPREGLGGIFHSGLGDRDVNIMPALRRAVDPQGITAGQGERHLRGLQRGRTVAEGLTHGGAGVDGGGGGFGRDGGYFLRMRLATFNILHGRSIADDRVDLDRFGEAVASLNADILALQEVDSAQPRSHHTDLTAVAADAMGARAHRFVAALSGTPGATWIAATEDEVPGAASYGVALLSRYPVRNWQTLRLPRIGFRFPLYLPGPGKVIIVDEEPRAAVIAHIDSPRGKLIVVNTHLSFVPGWNRRQLRRLRRDLATVTDPTVVMGDLNLDAPVPERILGFRSLAAHPTFPLDSPTQQLDHILVRGGLGTVQSSEAVRLPLSDHRALVVDVDETPGHV